MGEQEGRRKQMPTEPPFTAYIGNLPKNVDETFVINVLQQGHVDDMDDVRHDINVKRVQLLKNRETGAVESFCIVEFEDIDSLKNAVTLNGRMYMRGSTFMMDRDDRGGYDRGASTPEFNDECRARWMERCRLHFVNTRRTPELDISSIALNTSFQETEVSFSLNDSSSQYVSPKKEQGKKEEVLPAQPPISFIDSVPSISPYSLPQTPHSFSGQDLLNPQIAHQLMINQQSFRLQGECDEIRFRCYQAQELLNYWSGKLVEKNAQLEMFLKNNAQTVQGMHQYQPQSK